MKKPGAGTEQSKVFAVDLGPSWRGWARRRTDPELEAISNRLRRLSPRLFEFRIYRDLRVVFAFIKPATLQLAMCGSHDDVRGWLKENT